MNQNQVNYTSNEKLSQFKSLTSSEFSNTFDNVITKLITERGNSNKLSLANTSTPLNNRAFFGCVPVIAVFHPAKRYRQTVESKAIVLQKSSLELLAMFYKFLIIGENRLKISILASNEKEARSLLSLTSTAVLIARTPAKKEVDAKLSSPNSEGKSKFLIARTPAKGGLYA